MRPHRGILGHKRRPCGLGGARGAYPALADRANLCRTSGALEKVPAKIRGRYIYRSQGRGYGPWLKPEILAGFVAAPEGAAPLTEVRGFHLIGGTKD